MHLGVAEVSENGTTTVNAAVQSSAEPLSAAPATSPNGIEHTLANGRVAVHDPAIVEENGVYYLFGTHRRCARSTDMVHWERFDNNLSRDPYALLGDIWQAWPKQDSNPDLLGNTWAPDVIWNETMGKWCMYLSVNGDQFRSVIVLLTADHVDGDWTYVGPVVYSGFDESNLWNTDVPKVLELEPKTDGTVGYDLTRYLSLKDTHINAIDAAPALCEHGEMWMSFGSWFGGIWMFKLDPETGLRDYSVRYPLVKDSSDPYYGVKVAGGYWNSGEGSYFIRENGWWYLFMSYGWLGRTGGYQIRLFRSKSLLGPYVDQNGNPAISYGEIPDNQERGTGIRLTSSVQWDGGPAELADVEVSQGHNSAIRRSKDGRMFLVYHTRFAERFSEGDDEDYESHVRELLPTSDGWLVAAPYEYRSSVAVAPTGIADITGDYNVVLHDQHTFFNGKQEDDGTYVGINRPTRYTFHEDGPITRGEIVSFFDTPDANLPRSTDGPITCGSWKPLSGTVNGFNCCASDAEIRLDDVTYIARFATLPREIDGKPVMTFSAIGNNVCIWGSQS